MNVTYYTVDDLRPGRSGWGVKRFSALNDAISHYRSLPMDGARVRLFLCHHLLQLFTRPVGQKLVIQYANEILPVPSGCFSVREAGGKDCSTTGMRRASKAAPSIQKLVILPPILLPQRLRRQHQHLAGEVLLRTVTNAMLRAKEI